MSRALVLVSLAALTACGSTDDSVAKESLELSVSRGTLDTPYDAVDQDRSGTDLVDVDGDGYAADFAGGSDCYDRDTTVYPGAPESIDGVVDDGTDATDDDRDGITEHAGDCDDADAASSPISVKTADGPDNDCDWTKGRA